MRMKWERFALSAIVITSFLVVAPAAQASQVDMLIEKLVEKKILTRLDAESIRSEIETAEKKDFKAQIKSASPWLENLSSKGDVRLRYEAFNRESEDNRTTTGDAGGSDRNRFRFRVRWGLETKVGEEWKAGFRLASGEGTNQATSTNTTLDSDFGLKQVFFDQAYAIYNPTKRVKEMFPAVNKVEIGGGKVENPYSKWTTSIIWDGDVTPEGVYEAIDFRLMDNKDAEAYFDINTLQGQWILDEDSDSSPGDRRMFSYGAGATYQWAKSHNVLLRLGYYDWMDYEELVKSGSTLAFNPGGNDRNIDGFQIMNIYAETNFETFALPYIGKQPFKFYGDYAENLHAEAETSQNTTDETLANVGFRDGEEQAFSIGATIGKSKEVGDWQFNYEYLYIEPNAVVGNFSESDIGLGGTNNKGHRLAYKYMIWKNMELNLTAWLVERVNKTIYTYGSSGDLRVAGDDDQILRTQLDLVYKF